MKKIKIIENLSLLLFAFSTLLLTACVSDEESVYEDNGSYGIIELYDLAARGTSTEYAYSTKTVLPEDTYNVDIIVNYTGANGAPDDITVTLEIDGNIVTKEGTYTPVPSELYSVNSNTVIIPKGEKKATYTIVVKPLDFEASKIFAFGIRITSTTAGIISHNYSAGVFSVPIKSPWEGTYKVIQNWDLTQTSLGSYAQYFPSTFEDILITNGTSVRLESIGGLFGGYTYYSFNDNGTVNVTTSNATNINPTLKVLESSYDESTYIFHHKSSFTHPSYGYFILEETFTRIED